MERNEMKFITEITDLFENGKEKRRYGITLMNELSGKYVGFYMNGIVRILCYYCDNKREGRFIENYIEGTPMVVCNYKDDKLDGEYKEYSHETGEITTYQKYEDGIMKIQYNKPRIIFT